VQQQKFELLELPERVEGRPLPPVDVVDLRTKETKAATDSRILSKRLTDAIWQRLDKQEQTILLLNRRGYATFVQCRACGGVWQCHQCNVSLTYHRGRRRLVCHYCFHEEPAPTVCPRCMSTQLSFRGVGTEQVEREVMETFPQARIARMDVDTTSAKWAHHDILGRVERREVDILLGTQMIAKGLDFPFVTLVGVVNADVAMNLPDFRASERTFQLLTQVAGRAGRHERGGEVIVQTALPNHYAIRCAVEHDYLAFAVRELKERSGPRYPPHVRLVNVLVSGIKEGAVQEEADRSAQWMRALIDGIAPGKVEVTGPAPCPIDRIRGRWRWHYLLRSDSAKALGLVCRHLQYRYEFKPGPSELRLIIDRDPVSLL
jgi:primosomal protein N' (replication factor Y)